MTKVTTSSNHLWALLSRLALVLLLTPLASVSPTQAQAIGAVNDDAVANSVISIKLAPGAAATIEATTNARGAVTRTNAQGVVQTGLTAVDELHQRFGAVEMERIFRPAGRFEERHRRFGLHRWYTVRFAEGTNARSALAAYNDAATISIAELQYEKTRHVLDLNRISQAPADEAPNFIPDDPEYESQWHYNNTENNVGTPDADINLPEAHDIEMGSPEVVISIVDGGLDLDHPDFEGMLWVNEGEIPGNGIDDDDNGYVDDVHGYDHADDDGEPNASGSHGTHVAGTVAARNGNGQFGAGVAGGNGSEDSGIRLMINKTFGTVNAGFAESVVYAADMGAVVSQNSWGYENPGVFEQAVLDAIDYFNENAGGPDAAMNGGIYVNSSGNSNSSADFYPGFYEGAFAISATDENDERAGYSNYGDWIDVAAPGGGDDGGTPTDPCGFDDDDVWSAIVDGYGNSCGTSMAAPHVSGVIGLIASASPGIASDEVKDLLINTGVDVGADQPIGPRIDAYAALQALEDDDVPPAAITDLAPTGVSDNTVDLEWTAPGDDDNTGTANNYMLRWSADGPIASESDFENANPVAGVPAPEPAGTVQSHTVSGLPYSTEVYFAIRAVDNVGNIGDLSNSPSATTDPGPVISVDPEAFDVSLEVENSTEEPLTISHVGDPGAGPLEWTATIGAAPADMTTPADVAAPSPMTSLGGATDAVATAVASYDGLRKDVEETAMTYQLDDGTSENALGLGGLGDTYDMMWLNGFQAIEGAGTVTTIATTWGADGSANVPPEGMTGLALVYNDPNNDGNPNDAELLSQTEITVQDPGTNNFTAVEIAPTLVEDTFFIAVLLEDNDPSTYTAPMDESSTYQGASWYAGTSTGEDFNIEDLSANSTPPTELGGAGFPANWLLRAEGSAGFLAIAPTEGSVDQGQSQDVTATFDATGVAPGVYEASINVMSNDPSQPVVSVPSALEVTAGPPAIAVDPEALDFGNVFSGTSIIDTITVSNTGGTALEVTEATLSGDGAFSFVNPDDAGGYTIAYEDSRAIAVEFTPTETGSFSSTFEINTEQGVGASVSIQGEGAPFVTIEPGELTESIDLTTGDSTATQTFTVTNEFDESLPFSVFTEALAGEEINVYPQLVDKKLVRWRQMQEAGPVTSLRGAEPAEASLEAAPTPKGTVSKHGFARLMDPVDVLGYGNEVLAPELVSFDLGEPGAFTVLGAGFDSYAGNFTFGNNEEIYWIENETNLLKTYNIEDGSVEEIGVLEPESSGEGWTDIETDYTTGTTYVTTAEDQSGLGDFVSRLYELDPNSTELTFIGEHDGLTIAFAIDDEGEAYAHETSNDVILSVDLNSGEVETIGSTGIDANFAQSMTWDGETGQLLMAALYDCTIFGCLGGDLRQVDRETGATTPIGAFPDGPEDEFGWIATEGQGVPWLSTNLEQGVLPAGKTLTLEATFDATELVEGDYEAQISIVGEELQGQPSESIPVYLSVSAEPVLFLSKEEIEFDSTFVGGTTSPQMVTLRNDGAANMTITDVSLDSEAFQFEGETAFTLAPGQAEVFEVWFAPTEVAEYSAALSFEGEGVSGEVALEGIGIEAPVLAFTPESFEEEVDLGQVQEHTVEVTNEGGNPLEYDLSILPSTPAAQDVLLEEEPFDGAFPPEGWTRSGANNGENWELSDSDNAGGEAPEAEFYWSPSTEGVQRLISPAMNTEGLSRVIAQFDHYISSFNDGDYEARLESSSDGGETWTTVAQFPAEDVPATREVIAIDNEDVGSDQFHLAWTFDGDSFDLNWWDIDNVTVFAEGNWLAVDPEAGTLAPGESASLDVTVDTNVPGMKDGTYESGINFATNDPLAKNAELPFALNVIETLSVTLEPATGDDGIVYPNEEFSVPLVVESLDNLAVEAYQFTMTFDSDKLEALGVETEGTLSEDLTLASSISEGEIQVAAADNEEATTSKDAVLFSIEGEGTLVVLNMRAKEALGTSDLIMSEMIFNEGTPPASAHDDSVKVAPLYGDASLNLEVSAYDAAQTLQYVVDALDLSDVAVTSGDVTGNDELSAYDAALILDHTAGIIDCFPVEEGCGEETGPALAAKQKGKAATPSATLAWGEATRATTQEASSKADNEGKGQAIDLPLTLRNAAGSARAFQIISKVDPQQASVDGVTANLPEGWQMVHNVAEDGTVRIAIAGTTPLENDRTLATLQMHWLEEEAQIEMGGDLVINEAQVQQMEAISVAPIPEKFALKGNYPNPFGQATQIAIDLPARSNVRVEVYDILGRRVMMAQDGEMQAGTNQTVQIDGSRLASGLYLYRVIADVDGERQVDTGRMTLVR